MKRNESNTLCSRSNNILLHSSELILNQQNHKYDNDDENPNRSKIETISTEQKSNTTTTMSQKNMISIENMDSHDVTYRIKRFLRLHRSYLSLMVMLILLYYRALSRNELYYNHKTSMNGQRMSKRSSNINQKHETLWEHPELAMRNSKTVNDLRAFYSTKIPNVIQRSFSNVDTPFSENDVPLFLHLVCIFISWCKFV